MDFDRTLIDEVKRRPELYDNADRNFKNKELRQRVWSDIAYVVRGDRDDDAVKAVRNRWKSLRDSYVKETKHRMALSAGRAVRNKKNWRYSDAMSFLAPFLAISFAGHHYDNDEEETSNRNYYLLDASNEGHFMEPLLERMGDHEEESREERDDDDDVYSFFKGVADTVRKLSPANRVRVQREVVNMVLDVKLKEIQEDNNNHSR